MDSPPAKPRRPKERRREICAFRAPGRVSADLAKRLRRRPRFALIYAYSSQSTYSRRSRRRPPRRGFVRWRREPKPRLFRLPAPARAKILISIPPAWRSACRARAEESEPPLPPAKPRPNPSKHRRRRDPPDCRPGLSRPRRRRALVRGLSGVIRWLSTTSARGGGVLRRSRARRFRPPKYFCRMYSQHINDFLKLFITRLRYPNFIRADRECIREKIVIYVIVALAISPYR
jgi:hypothetical protein